MWFQGWNHCHGFYYPQDQVPPVRRSPATIRGCVSSSGRASPATAQWHPTEARFATTVSEVFVGLNGCEWSWWFGYWLADYVFKVFSTDLWRHRFMVVVAMAGKCTLLHVSVNIKESLGPVLSHSHIHLRDHIGKACLALNRFNLISALQIRSIFL